MTYLCAEIGQNHSGALTNVLDLIRIAANPQRSDLYGPDVGGVDAVKLTKRSLDHELARSGMDASYTGPNSFGATYGEHRAALELSDEEHAEAYHYAKDLGLDFVETLCAPQALSLLDHFTPDYLKVASRDLTNHRLLDALAETGIPLTLSTGMAGPLDLDQALTVVTRHHHDVRILHCVSEYPTRPENVNLRTIEWLKDHYPGYPIGFSNHSQGLAVPLAAVAMGAEILEFHVTLSRQMRGTDHPASFDPDGVYRLVRDVRTINRAMGRREMRVEESSRAARAKLERSVATAVDLPAGHRITEGDVEPLSPGSGIPWPERGKVVGGITVHPVPAKELLTATMAS